MTNNFVKIIHGDYAKIPIGAVGIVKAKTQVMGQVQVDVTNYGTCRLWNKNLVSITKKEYFIKALQGNENGEQQTTTSA